MDHPNDDDVAGAAARAIAAAIELEDDDTADDNVDAADDTDDTDDDDEDDELLLLNDDEWHIANDDDHVEEEDVIYDPAEGKLICDEAMAILKHRLDFPAGQRDKSIVQFAQQFIINVKEDIHDTITDIQEEGYDGLDSARDTEAEVETAIRCCPENLTRREGQYGLWYPIRCLTTMRSIDDDETFVCNVKAVSFVPLFTKLAIEFDSFAENERGGLLIEDEIGKNTLHYLAFPPDPSLDEHRQQHIMDTTFLAVLVRLRQAGWLIQDDIQKYYLVPHLCLVPGQRFRFMTEWDPSSLLKIDTMMNLPIHWTVDAKSAFEVVLDAMFRFYPKWKGLHALFHEKEGSGHTAFELACKKLTRNTVIEVVEAILVRYSGTTPLNIGDALLMAAIDDNSSLDGLYFLMRRHPATMLSMVRRDHQQSTTPTILSSLTKNKGNNRNGDIHSITNSNANTNNAVMDDHNINTNINTNTDTRKRKRN